MKNRIFHLKNLLEENKRFFDFIYTLFFLILFIISLSPICFDLIHRSKYLKLEDDPFLIIFSYLMLISILLKKEYVYNWLRVVCILILLIGSGLVLLQNLVVAH